jgi:hypothetical protein
MKKSGFIISFLLMAAGLFGQPVMQIASNEHDFGVFKEESGSQKYNFEVRNTGNAPLVIQNIQASCGCTTPEWTKTPIPPNGKGVITAIYDPANRPGVFNKTLTVYTNSKPEVTVLVIKGEVTPREKTVEDIYTWPVGNIRFESNHLAFTAVKKTETKSRSMIIINTSNVPVKIEFDGLPVHLDLKANPATLQPGQKGVIEGTYDGTKNPGWGTLSDLVRVKLNGELQQNGYYYISANLVEDFSKLTADELINSPVFKLASATVDIGTMAPATNKDVEFRFKNEGKRDLIIRYIRPTCGCTAVKEGGSSVIKPGENGIIKASFNSGGYKGKVTKAIYVYTNDPKNSEVILMLNAEVIDKTN